MPASFKDENTLTIKFGGGVNSAASEDDISPTECVSGQNFTLDYKNKNLSPRAAVKKLGMAPNGLEIRGFINHVDENGSSTVLVQAGDKIYNWSESIGFIQVGTVNSSAKLRGPLHQYWPLDDVTIITDITLTSPVLLWNGSALSTMTHNLTGDFKAKYCWVDNERAIFANVVSNSVATPHMVVTSTLSDYQTLSIADRPSSALGAADPYYLLSPDLRPINGMVGFYNSVAVSTEKGSIFKISGSDSTDTEINQYYPRSFATGAESMCFTGNDVVFGRTGRIESFVSTQNYGDVAVDDLTATIKDQIKDQSDWSIVYNSRTQKIYAYAAGTEGIWQYSKDMDGTNTSGWVKITTLNSFAMAPSCMMVMVDPVDNLEYTYMGDTSGNIYKIEGDEGALDMDENDIQTTWRSGLFKLNRQMIAEKFTGYVSYRSGVDTEITVKLLHAGSYPSDAICVVSLQGSASGNYFGGEAYFGGDYYFGTAFEGRFRREQIVPEGGSEEVQVEITHEGSAFFEINEIGFSFSSKTNP